MKTVIQRVKQAAVWVNGQAVASLESGLLVLAGIAIQDTETDAAWMAKKIAGLRIFEDSAGKMNLSLGEIQGSVLAVPQFTLLANCQHGRRPDFTQAAPPEEADKIFHFFCRELASFNLQVCQGVFRAHMLVKIENDGPVTIILDSRAGSSHSFLEKAGDSCEGDKA